MRMPILEGEAEGSISQETVRNPPTSSELQTFVHGHSKA